MPPSVEFYIPVAGQQLNFEGLFSMKEVFRIMDKYFRTKGWDKKIIFDEQYDTEKGRYVHVKSEYYKKTDAYVRLQTRQWIYANELKEVEKEVDGVKIKTNQGKLSIVLDAFIQTEYFGQWPADRPVFFLFKVIYEHYLARSRIAYWENVCRHITNELKAELAGYLNLNKFMYER
ncbi:hypothetical protein JXC34_04430 [Candidatus Woesearchaeota archaeon]|nr:hypothetical protein [Candidatus Woesearchaeota archaeon]